MYAQGPAARQTEAQATQRAYERLAPEWQSFASAREAELNLGEAGRSRAVDEARVAAQISGESVARGDDAAALAAIADLRNRPVAEVYANYAFGDYAVREN